MSKKHKKNKKKSKRGHKAPKEVKPVGMIQSGVNMLSNAFGSFFSTETNDKADSAAEFSSDSGSVDSDTDACATGNDNLSNSNGEASPRYDLRNKKRPPSLEILNESDKRPRIVDQIQTSEDLNMNNKINPDTNLQIPETNDELISKSEKNSANGSASINKQVQSEPNKNKPNPNDQQIPKSDKTEIRNPGNDNGSAKSYASITAGLKNSTTEHQNVGTNDQKIDKSVEKAEPLKENFQESAYGDEIEVTFEVLLSEEMNFPNGKVRIVFGPPLSDWKTQLVEMKIKEGTEGTKPENYLFLTGVLYLQKNLQSKSIPYKYIVEMSSQTVWEHIEVHDSERKDVNRCLLVPSQITKNSFVKFDDVILSNGSRWVQRLKLGRQMASKWMMPRPSELDNPKFDFEVALERFHLVIKSHEGNGTILCLGDVPRRKYNPVGYNINEQLNIYQDNFLKRIESYLKKSDDMGKLLRAALWILLLVRQRNMNLNLWHSLKILEAFKLCQDLLFDHEEQLPKSINGEIGITVCKALHQFIQNLVNMPVFEWKQDSQSRGNWIYVIPFIHFWDPLEQNLEQWLNLNNWKRSLQFRSYSSLQYLEYVAKMTAIDSKLNQVFLAMLEFKDMEDILTAQDMFISILTPHQLLEMLLHILERSTKFTQACQKILARFQEEIVGMQKRAVDNKICVEDLEQIQSWSNQIKTFLQGSCPDSWVKTFQLFNLFLNIIVAYQPLLHDSTLIDYLAQSICAELRTTSNFPRTCEAWSAFLPKFLSLDQALYQQMLKTFQTKVGEMKPDECLLALMSEANFQTKEISDTLFARAVLVLEEKSETSTFKYLVGQTKFFLGFSNKHDHRVKNLARLFSKCISDLKCHSLQFPHAIRIVTETPAASKLVRFFPKLLQSDLLSSEDIKNTRWILAQVNQFLYQLDQGQLSLETIALLKEKPRQDYLTSFQVSSAEMKIAKNVFSSLDVKNLIQLRLQEMEEFYGAKKDVFDFLRRLEITSTFKPLTSQFEIDRSRTQLVQICQPRSSSIEVIALKLDQISQEEREVVQRHNSLFNQSVIFRQIFAKNKPELELTGGEYDDWEQLILMAEELLGQFEEFVRCLSLLEMPIGQVQTFFREAHRDGKLHKELTVLEEAVKLNQWVSRRVESTINQMFIIDRYAEAAQAVKEAAAVLGRTKAFEVVDRILSVTLDDSQFEQQPLSVINEELIHAGKLFSSWKANQIKALKSLDKCRSILKFLQESIKDRNGLKTFYDLATISAGESDLEVDRLRHFYHSVNAYSPLILDLNIEGCTFEEFLKACASVFTAMELDQSIAEKLIDSSNRNLEWIKACEDQRGSVEQSSLTMVSKINQTGVYTISMPRKQTTQQIDHKQIDQCIKMSYQKVSNEPDSMKELHLAELQELRSKLMLITAGVDGKKDVDRFVTILSLIELVAEHYVALRIAGCYLFAQFKLQILCDASKKVKLSADFGRRMDSIFRGENEVELELENLADFLKVALDTWSKHVFVLRDENPSLNYFTTDQLVILSAQLAQNLDLSQQATMLLNLISPELNPKQLANVIKASLSLVPIEEEMPSEEESLSDAESADDKIDPFQVIKSTEAFKTLSEDFNEDLVIAALIVTESDEIDTLTEWCLNSTHSDEDCQKILANYCSSSALARDNADTIVNRENNFQRFEQDFKASDLLSHKIKGIWLQFIGSVNSSEITDHLSFQALAKCMEDLLIKHGSCPNRKMPPTLMEGCQNLVVCSNAEMHAIAASFYMLDPEKAKPSVSEVLICDSETPREQIELLCRRAFTDKTGKIFLVMHAEKLSYNTGVFIESLFKKTTVSNKKYKLIFMASKEHNDHSYIVTAFEKYRRQMIHPPQKIAIKKYLLVHSRTQTSSDPDNVNLRIIKSNVSGNGKSLVAKRLAERARNRKVVIQQLHDNVIDFDCIITNWQKTTTRANIYHLDLTPAAHSKRDDLLFSLAFLGGLISSRGQVWLSSKQDYYTIETTVPLITIKRNKENEEIKFEDCIPTISCLSPDETNKKLTENPGLQNELLGGTSPGEWIYLFDLQNYNTEVFQRPYLYLNLSENSQNGLLEYCSYNGQPQSIAFQQHCLDTLLNKCSVKNPTWMELTHFASFLNRQLSASEKSIFCNADLMREDFPGMKNFVVSFLVQMAKDFATRSVEISDQSHGESFSKLKIDDRHCWETSPHPYIFFNDDGHSMSFFGFRLDCQLNLIDERLGTVLEPKIMTKALYDGLTRNGVIFNVNFDQKSEIDKIADLCRVLGVKAPNQNPDKTYELTSDNVMKMLAIYTRFKSNIPVIIMGETGSGKTRLVKFMCEILRQGQNVNNLLILKTHGGISEQNIYDIVNEAVRQAKSNKRQGISYTILFFDEANTTNAIGTIKEVMCDRLVNGIPIPDDIGLQFVAAVNPYREHSEEMIEKLEKAGLGYHIKYDKTADKLGSIPMRRLVYRVKEIPASMFPLIWDFGTIDKESEKKYVAQMIAAATKQQGRAPVRLPNTLLRVIYQSQQFMRERKDECSFVSLRDVERFIAILQWFKDHSKFILPRLLKKLPQDIGDQDFNLILSLGVSYFTRLDKQREDYAAEISRCLTLKPGQFMQVIIACQDIFIDELKLDQNIAKNDALKENVWMMAICIDLRIPLFLVGKPGSSKSLAKTVITDVMQGDMSYSALFKHFKEIHMVSFQCSPLATAGGILSTFRQCHKFQEKRDLNRFTAVCVLDEVGLAEDSLKMPLKALHPLLEDGCIDNDKPEPHKKVSFIGISNWALDPAKMNRGILLSRGVPTQEDLIKSAEGICSSNKDDLSLMKAAIHTLANGYYEVYKKQEREREYFGLRDFYSLVKMVCAQVHHNQCEPNEADIVHAVQRNFGGYFGNFKPAEVFLKSVYPNVDKDQFLPPKDLIVEAIKQEGETRYILLLTKNNAALNIIQEQALMDMSKTTIIFGSSFADDQEYRQICLNINRIKIAMELGHTVILCNLNNLYESLYDALNQNYTTMSDSRYVDLGLGTHRVKCRIHKDFRLVLIAEDQDVYEKFPIPLINRLEKHYLGMETMLDQESHLDAVSKIKSWLCLASEVDLPPYKRNQHFQQFSPGDVFIGYHNDAPASIVLRLNKDDDESSAQNIFEKAKLIFLETATPDAISRISETKLCLEEKKQLSEGFYNLSKNSLPEVIENYSQDNRLLQVTTFSRLLAEGGKKEICRRLNKDYKDIQLLSLQQINTEEQFSKRVANFLDDCQSSAQKKVLIIQTQVNPNTANSLVECTRYSILNQVQLKKSSSFSIILVLQVPRIMGGFFSGFPGIQWKAVHIDELCGDPNNIQLAEWNNKTLYSVLENDEENKILRQLILECIPQAASLAYESKDLSSSRTVKCVQVLNHCLQNDEEFVTCLRTKVLGLVKETPSHQPEKWMSDLAVGSIRLKEGNTFARAVWLHLLDKVCHHLSQIIAACDLHSGLDHVNDTEHSWISHLYIKMMAVVSTNPKQIQDTLFSSHFPFSWAVLNQLDRLSRETDSPVGSLEAVFLSTPMGSIVQQAFKQNPEDCLRLLLPDMAHLEIGNKLKPDSIAMNLVCEEIFKVAKQTRSNSIREEDFEDTVYVSSIDISATDIYKATHLIKHRLQIAVSIISIVPGVEKKLEDSPSSHFNLDVRAINFAFDSLVPVGSTMLDDQDRAIWSSKITTLSTIYKQIDSMLGKTDVTTEDQQLMASAKQKGQRAQIAKLYLDHVLQKDVDQKLRETVARNLAQLWSALKDIDFTQPKSFDNILFSIDSTCRKAGEALLEQKSQECVICLEALSEPVALPCGHVGCKKCLEDHFQSSVNRFCPTKGCREEINKEFAFKSSVDLKIAVQCHSKFKDKLNQFFTELLQQFVYQKGTAAPHQATTDKLLSFVVTKCLPKDKRAKPRTKTLSPFPGDYIDPKPVIRSFILQLLFRFDTETMETNLQKFIEEKEAFIGDGAQFPELCIMIVQCLEDSMIAKEWKVMQWHKRKVNAAIQHMRSQLEKRSRDSLVKSLWNTALDRLAINTVADAINSYLTGEVEINKLSDVLKTAVDFVQHHAQGPNVQKYLIRVIASKHQVTAIMEWKKRGVFLDLLPEELRNVTENEVPDMFLLIDSQYKEVRNALRAAWLSDSYEELVSHVLSTQNKPGIWTLAFHHLTRVNPSQIRNSAAFDTFLAQYPWLGKLWTNHCQTLIEKLNNKTHRHDSLLNLIVHFKVCVLHDQVSQFLTIFKKLVTNASGCATLYLPTMPHDETVEAKKAVKDATMWYTCSQNHTYAIGDCGQPAQIGKCPTCGEPIGGQNHAFVRPGQVRQAEIHDTTKTGHVLGKALPGSRSTTIRETGGLEVAITRCILHLAMLLGCQTHPREILKTLKSPHANQNPEEFLIDHLLLNLWQIAECLGQSENEALILLHQIIESLGKLNHVQGNWQLNTKESVAPWESIFVKSFIQPALGSLENSVSRHRIAIQEDKDEASNVLQEIIHEKSRATKDKSKILDLTQFWRPRENISIARIETKLGAKRLKAHCPFLHRFLEDELAFQEIVHLPELIELANFLIQNYGRQVEVCETEITISKFVNKMSVGDRKYVLPLINIYILVVNNARLLKDKRIGNQLEQLLRNDDVTLTSPSSILFPASHGLGLVATFLFRYLVDEHNSILKALAANTNSQLNTVTCLEILDSSMLVAVDAQDLHLALVANSECNFGLEDSSADHFKWTVNENGLEQHVIDRFLSGKPLIDVISIPHFEYRMDNDDTANTIEELRAKIRQLDSLPSIAIGVKLESELAEIRDVSSLLDILKTTTGILAKIGGNQNESILETILRLKIISTDSANYKDVIPKSLNYFTLGHLEQLMIKLRFVRAKRMVCNNQSPFHKAGNSFREQLPVNLINSIDKLLHLVQPEIIATELLDFIHVVIDSRQSEDDDGFCEREFASYFAEFLKQKDVKDCDHILRQISMEIRIKHCISVFGIIAGKIQQRN